MIFNIRLGGDKKPTKEDRDLVINTKKFQEEWKKEHGRSSLEPDGCKPSGCKPSWRFWDW